MDEIPKIVEKGIREGVRDMLLREKADRRTKYRNLVEYCFSENDKRKLSKKKELSAKGFIKSFLFKGAKVPLAEVYRQYSLFCEELELRKSSKKEFLDILKNAMDFELKTIKGTEYLIGIELNPDIRDFSISKSLKIERIPERTGKCDECLTERLLSRKIVIKGKGAISLCRSCYMGFKNELIEIDPLTRFEL